jgi:plastocyanin
VLLAGVSGVAALGPVLWLTAQPAAAFAQKVSIVNFGYSPSTAPIKPGDKIIWVNDSNTKHTVTADSGGTAFDYTIGPGRSEELRFDQVGTYTYHCNIHSQMKGKIEVADPSTSTTAAPATTTTTAPPTTTTTAAPATTTTAEPTTTGGGPPARSVPAGAQLVRRAAARVVDDDVRPVDDHDRGAVDDDDLGAARTGRGATATGACAGVDDVDLGRGARRHGRQDAHRGRSEGPGHR